MFLIISALLAGFSLAPSLAFLSFFCLLPLWWYLQKPSLKLKIPRNYFLFWWIFLVTGLHWLGFAFNQYYQMPYRQSFSLMVLVCGLLASPAWFFGWWLKTGLSSWRWPLVLSLHFLIFSYMMPLYFSDTWLVLELPMAQLASLVGFRLLNIVHIFLVWFLYLSLKNKNLRYSGAAFLLFVVLNIGGWFCEPNLSAANSQNLKVALIQGNIANDRKMIAHTERASQMLTVDQYFLLSQRAIKNSTEKIDLLVWPETALPLVLSEDNSNEPLLQEVGIFLKGHQLPLLTGGYFKHQGLNYNAVFYFNQQGELSQEHYRKNKRLPFGEFAPGAETLPILSRWFSKIPRFESSEIKKPLKVQNQFLAGVQICYEVIFSEETRAWDRQAVNFIFNPTNDTWFGPTWEQYQHLSVARTKAVEFNLPIIRATNSGYSALIAANGEMELQVPRDTEGALVGPLRVSRERKETLYSLAGGWIELGSFILLLLALAGVSVHEARILRA